MTSHSCKPLLAGLAFAMLLAACGKEPAAAAAPVTASAPGAPVAPVVPAAPTQASEPVTTTAATTDAPTPAATPSPASTMDWQAALQAFAGKGIAKAVSLATNAQAHEYAGVLAAVTGQLLETDPDACGRLLLPGTFGGMGWDRFPENHRERFVAVQQAIFATAQDAPTPAPGEDEAGPLYDAAIDKVMDQHGAHALDGLQGDAGPAAACRAWNRVYAALAAESVDDGGRVVRWLNAP